jgi:hypothetical protein
VAVLFESSPDGVRHDIETANVLLIGCGDIETNAVWSRVAEIR